MRRVATGLLILVSALCLFVSSVSLWTRHNVINTQVFVSNVDTIVDLPPVQARINQKVTDAVMTSPDVQNALDSVISALPPRLQQFRPTVEDGVRSLVSAAMQRVLTNDPFRPLTNAAVTSAHTQLVNGQPVRFTIGQAKAQLPASANTGLVGQVLGLIPNDLGVTIVTPADAPQLYNAIDLLKSVWWWVGLAALLTLAGALGMSRYRRGTLRAWSVTVIVLFLLELVSLRIARGQLVAAARPENRDALGAMYDVFAHTLRSWTLWLLAFAVVVLLFTLLWGRLGIIPAVRRGIGQARAHVAARREAREAEQVAGQAVLAEGAPAGELAVVEQPSWSQRVAANTRAFAEGMDLDRRAAQWGGFAHGHLRQLRWAGIAVGAVVLLFWPGPTLSVLIWIVAFVALYLGALEWLVSQAPPEAAAEPTEEALRPAEPSDRSGSAAVPTARMPSNGVPALVPVGAPAEMATGGAAPAQQPAPLSGEAMSYLSQRLDLMVRLGAARDAGVLSDEEFTREKARLLSG